MKQVFLPYPQPVTLLGNPGTVMNNFYSSFNKVSTHSITTYNLTVLLLDLGKMMALRVLPLSPHGDHVYHLKSLNPLPLRMIPS